MILGTQSYFVFSYQMLYVMILMSIPRLLHVLPSNLHRSAGHVNSVVYVSQLGGGEGVGGEGVGAGQKGHPPHTSAMSPGAQCRPSFLPELLSPSHQVSHVGSGAGVGGAGVGARQKGHPPQRFAMSPGAQCQPSFLPELLSLSHQVSHLGSASSVSGSDGIVL